MLTWHVAVASRPCMLALPVADWAATNGSATQLNIILVAAVTSINYGEIQLSRAIYGATRSVLFDPRTFFTTTQSDNLISRTDCDDYAEALRQRGLILIRLQFADPGSAFVQTLVQQLGRVDVHDNKGTTVWDVKYDSTVDPETGARSLTTRSFPLHTDASFEDPPPQYVALYVVKEDSLGGGLSQIVDARRLLPLLSTGTVAALQNTLFKFKVPDEFRKDDQFIERAILDDQGNFRYRREVLVIEALSPEQLQAIDELDAHLYDGNLVESMFLPTGTILIFHNGRFLHARSEVKDKSRHLVRMRFNGRPYEAVSFGTIGHSCTGVS